ncbi:hypothetical protein DY000_02026151 [Brassica cretica]|uniref:Fungal lipase-type domain-containing protein n=1 Tax=Brassica cretica TaxID=69181 RepID=A0ABQ7E191_BRACR|nr:hypothetical protein DY000_02026151 [Brassica cretica]
MKREALANPWYESFGFSLLETLINPDDSSIYGAVYMYKHYDSYQKTPLLGKPPLYVIAFRSTMLSSGKRANNAKRAIENVLSYPNVDTESVWLAGHSLGAGIALVAGKNMARSGSPLKTYAFNPPHSDFPVEELLDSEKLKRKVRIARSFIKTTFASLFNLQVNMYDLDTVLVARNSLIFEAKSSNPVDVATRALKLAREWITGFTAQDFKPKVNRHLPDLTKNRGTSKNQKQHAKLIVAWNKQLKQAGLAWIFSGRGFNRPLQGSSSQGFVDSTLMAEALAMRLAIITQLSGCPPTT